MFSSSRTKYSTDSFSKNRAGKSTNGKSKRSFKDRASFNKKLPAELDLSSSDPNVAASSTKGPSAAALKSPVLTISVGRSPPRLFAAHRDILLVSPFFQSALHSQFYQAEQGKLHLPDEIPEVFSSVLEFLYRGDYFPRLSHDPRTGRWSLENEATSPGNSDSTVLVPPSPTTPSAAGRSLGSPASNRTWTTTASTGPPAVVLKDTAVYCAAERFGLAALKRLALRKQGLQSGVAVSTILSSARYAYGHTPESDSRLRAHYLHLIIRSRDTFKRSGTMQAQMGMACTSPGLAGPGDADGGEGTGLWFDLFCAMCNVMDDMEKMVGKSGR